MFLSKKWLILIILLTLLFTLGNVFANEEGVNDNQTISDSSGGDISQISDDSVYGENSDEILIENWDELQYYSSLKDSNYVLKLKEDTNYYPSNTTDVSYQVIFNNNVTIVGASGAYIGDSSPDARNITYAAMKVPDNSGVGITLKNVTFKWISTRYQPDGVFLVMGGNSVNYIQDCYFANVSTNLGHSSILHIKLGDAIVENCTFINCTTDFGCLSVYNPNDDPTGLCTRARMNVSDSYFEGNYARTEPGCINNCGILIVRNSTFYKNSAFWWAGAIHTHGGANTTIYDSDFLDNLAGWNGGALYTYSYLQIYNTRFIGNNCTTNNGGGAIGACKYLHAPYIHIEDSLFENNENLCWSLDELSTTGTGRGGAISLMDDGGLDVFNCTFIRNSASIGTAICAIKGGLTYGSPDVRIIGNRFINHTRVGDVLDVRVATGSISEISDNYFLNNSIVFSKLKLIADDPDSSGRVKFQIDAALKNPDSYDEDILDKSAYDVYVDGVYRTTVSSRTFTLNLESGNIARVYVIPSISNSKSNEVLAGKVKTYIYVSQSRGNDNNNGLSRSQPVKTLNKSIELAKNTTNIIIMDGTFKENNLVIDYNLTLTGENYPVISVSGYGFKITAGDVKFEKITFKNCKQSSANDRIIEQTGSGFLILDDCTFENNQYNYLIDAASQVEAQNLRFTGNTACLFLTQSIVIKSSIFTGNIANSNSRNDALFKPKTKTVKFIGENLTFINNDVLKGCIFLKGSATLTDCNFIGNYMTGSSNQRSSGVFIDGGPVVIRSCKFINSTDIKTASVIYVSSGPLVVQDSIFINNSYENGKAIINGGTSGLKAITASNNWWGNTPDDLSKPNLIVTNSSNAQPGGWDPAKTWLIFNVTALSDEIEINKPIPVQFIFTSIDKEGNITNYDGYGLPNFDLNLNAVNGTCSNSKVTVVNGMATTYFTLTQRSSASLTGSFNGIDVTINFEFKKSTPDVVISTDSIMVGDDADITVNVNSGVSGNIVLKVGNFTETKPISNSKAVFTIPDLPFGNYTIEANYTGNELYESVVNTTNLTVNRHDSTTTLSVGSIELNKDVVFTVTLSDGATGSVDVYVNGVKHTINAGQTYTISNISRGDYVVKAVYNGDSYYLASEDEYSFEVGKLIPSLEVSVSDITYGNDTVVNVNLNGDSTGNVSVTIDGKTTTAPLKNGNAKVIISGITVGNNKQVYVNYSGDNNYKNASTVKTYNVNKAVLNFTVTYSDIKLGDDAKIEIRLPQRSGGTLTISGIKSETKNVPLTGLVTLTYSDLEVGEYTVNVKYEGDNYYTTEKSITFKVSDWNAAQWPNEGYDVGNSEKSPYSSQANGNVLWIKDIASAIVGNMVIDSEGNIYVICANEIYSIGNDGSINWVFSSNDAGNNFSGLAVGRDVVIAPKSADKLYFINQTTGLQFSNNIYQGSSIFSPVIDENANIYVASEYQTSTATYNLVIVPYKNWRTSTKPVEIGIGNSAPLTAPVIINSNIVAIGTQSELFIIDVSSQRISEKINVTSTVRPVVGPGNILYTISDNSKVVAIAADGTKIREIDINGTPGSYLSVGENGEIYSITREGKLYDYSSGEETLIYDFEKPVSSGLLVGKDGNLYVGLENGEFCSIDTDGNLLWKVNLNQSISGLPVMDNNGVIYVISGNRIVAINYASLSDSKLNSNIKNVSYGQDVVVDIDLNSQATGIVTIKIGNYYVDDSQIVDGKASFTVPGLNAGDYTAEITYNGDNRFDSKTVNVRFNVAKIDSPMDVNFNNIEAGGVLHVYVTGLASDASGTISVSVKGKSNSSNVKNGKANVDISGLVKGEYEVNITYSGDINYNQNSLLRPLSVGYVPIEFNPVSKDITVGQDVEIDITGLPNDANGVFYIDYNNVRYTGYVEKGSAKITIHDLYDGTYDFDVIYVNDTKYSANSQKVHVVVSKIKPAFNVSVENINVGDDLVVDVSGLPDDATGLVIVSVADISKNASVANGGAKIVIPQKLTNGTYNLTVNYTGDRIYYELTDSKTVEISKKDINFTISVDNINVGDDLVVDVSGLAVDATGQITVSVDEISNSSYVENGISSVTIHQRLANGTYSLTVSYAGDERYNPLSKSVNVKISKITPQIVVIAPEDIYIGSDFVVTVSGLPKDTKAKYVDLIGDIVEKVLIEDGACKFTISDLSSGSYSYSFNFEGDDRYDGFKVDKVVNVNKIRPQITVESEDIDYGEPLNVVVHLPDDATGSVIVSGGDDSQSGEVNNGIASVVLSGLTAEVKTINVEYLGDDRYESASASKEVVISKIDPKINITCAEFYVGDDLNVKVSFPDDASGMVNISVGNISKVDYIKDGIVNVRFSNLGLGNQTINVKYVGDINYNEISESKQIVVNKMDSIMDVVAAESISAGNDLNISVYLPNANGIVNVSFNNAVVDSSDFINGVARLVIHNLTVGNHSYTISYGGDEKYNAYITIKNVTVNKINPKMNVTSNNVNDGDDLVVKVVLPSDAKGSVDISINSKIESVGINNGIADYVVTDLTKGSYKLTVTYGGDDQYDSDTFTKQIDVGKLNVSFDVSVKSVSYGEDVIVDISGLPDDALGNVTVLLNKDEYSSKVSGGNASLTISGLNAGSYVAVVSYGGDEKYMADQKSASFDVAKITPSIEINVSDITVGEKLNVAVILPDDATGEVTVSIDDDSQVVNVRQGIASVSFSALSAGSKTVEVQYIGDTNYKSNITSKSVLVNKRDPVMVIQADDIEVGNNLVIKVSINEDATGNLTISVDGKSYKIRISEGFATLTSRGLTEGIKIVNVTYSGDGNYNPIFESKSVTVNKRTPSMTVQAENINYGEDLIVNVSLNDDASGDVTVSVGGKTFTSHVIRGTATFTIPGLSTDDNSILVDYLGDDKYSDISQSKSINISMAEPLISISAGNISVGDSLNVIVELPEDATGIVQINVSGIVKIANINNGIASVNISDLNDGNHIVNVEYSGNKNYNSVSDSVSITVSKVNPKISIAAEDIRYGQDLIFRINLPSDATGQVAVRVDGIIETLELNRGTAVGNVSNLTAGDKVIDVIYMGDDKYNPATASQSVAVNKINPQITVLADNIKYGESLNVNVQLSHAINGTVMISVGDISKTVQSVNGLASCEITGLSVGSPIVNVRFEGDSIYNASQASKTINVGMIAPEISITADDIRYGEKLDIKVNLNSDATGSVVVSVSGISRTIPVKNGVVTLSLDDLIAGNKTIIVKYAGDDNYYSASAAKQVTVSKINTPLIIHTDNISYGENLIVNVNLDKEVSGNVVISIADIHQTEKIVNGNVSVAISDLESGNYTLIVKYEGDNNYLGIENTTSLSVLKVDIPVSDETIQESDDSGSYSVNLPSDATGTLTVTVDGINYTAKLTGGKATVNIPELSQGSHNVTITYSGDKKYSSITRSKVLTVNKTSENTTADKKDVNLVITANDINVGENAVINVITSLNSAKLTLTLNNRDYELSVENGKASLSVSDLAVGKYDVIVKFAGDGEYLPAENSTSLNVLKAEIPVSDDVLPDSKDLTVYSISLPSDASGTLTVTVDGKQYSSKLINGKTTVNIPELGMGSHNITVAYSGDAKYSPIVKNKIVNVPVVKLTGNDISMLYTSGGYYKVYLTQDGTPLSGKTVTVMINGVKYTPTTDSNGYASVKITLPPNKYVATASYGDLNTTNNVVVKGIVKAKNVNAKKSAKSIKIKVSLKKVNKKYLKGKKVTLKFNKKKFKVKTNKKGVATFTIKSSVYKKLKVGKKYTYQVSYGKNKVKKTIKFK